MAFHLVKLLDPLNPVIITGGLVPRGAYDNATDYAVGDSVDYLGSSYVMHTNASAGTLPTDTDYWQVLANKGDTGAAGATGSTGADGEGVPVGGTTGQVLSKASNTDFDTAWSDAGSGDMAAATYDPQAIADDAFDRANHTGEQAISTVTGLQTALDGKVDENSSITGATKTKITYDAKGLVTAGADATQDDIGDGTTYKQYSATEKTKLSGIETSADVTDTANVTAAGALMDSEVTNLAAVKAFDPTDYAAALGADDNYVTDAEKTKLSNLSGTNTGDQDLSPYFHKTNDDTDDITVGTTNKFATATEKTKLGHISVTQAVDLDAIESASHAAVTVADTAEIDLTLTGQQISASIVASSIDESKLDASVNASLDLADTSVQLSGAQTVAGVKTFSSSPIVPTPTTDFQAATKKYVDDNAGAGGVSESLVIAYAVTL